jgi:hypothetical protein
MGAQHYQRWVLFLLAAGLAPAAASLLDEAHGIKVATGTLISSADMCMMHAGVLCCLLVRDGSWSAGERCMLCLN